MAAAAVGSVAADDTYDDCNPTPDGSAASDGKKEGDTAPDAVDVPALHQSACTVTVTPDDGASQECRVPHLSLWHLFTLFLSFGVRAFGGPVASLSLIKDELVVTQRWISLPKFNRVLAVYQLLPGPEATEICCYFGRLCRGYVGSVVAGLGFMLPGFTLMLIAAWLYTTFGMQSATVARSFAAMKPVVVAVVCNAVRRLAEHALQSPVSAAAGGSSSGSGDRVFDTRLLLLAIAAAFWSVVNMTVFATLAFCGFSVLAVRTQRRGDVIAVALFVVMLALFVVLTWWRGPAGNMFGGGSSMAGDSYSSLFLTSLLAGAVVCVAAAPSLCFRACSLRGPQR